MGSDHVILITGCSTGIGRALAEELHSRGHVVWATARRPETLSDLDAKGLLTAALDVNDETSIRDAVERVLGESGRIDLLVNNAGFNAIGPLAELPMDRLRLQFETNVFGLIALVQAVAPGMIERGSGTIVNVGSIVGVLATPFAGAYCATKAAVHLASDALRMELAPFGVRVVTVQPGAIRSSMGDNASRSVSETLREDSAWGAVRKAIHARARASQENPTSTEEFARRCADEVLASDPKPVIRIGKHSTFLPFLSRWVPKRALDSLLSRQFGLDRLRASR